MPKPLSPLIEDNMAVSHENNSSGLNVLDATQDLLNSIVEANNENTSTADHLVVTGRGSLKWEGSFEDLPFLAGKFVSKSTVLIQKRHLDLQLTYQ